MRALVRKYPVNAHSEENNEVWYYPWHNGDEQGRPYTLEGYRYAMCEDAPEPTEDYTPTANDFEVTEHTREDTDETGETRTVKYWTATYVGNTANTTVETAQESTTTDDSISSSGEASESDSNGISETIDAGFNE